jgi:hypothetical protein
VQVDFLNHQLASYEASSQDSSATREKLHAAELALATAQEDRTSLVAEAAALRQVDSFLLLQQELWR